MTCSKYARWLGGFLAACALAACALAGAFGPAVAIVAVSPQMVGPPVMNFSPACPTVVNRLNGAGAGPTIPVPALLLGAPVIRSSTSFTTGGSGTANFAEAARRRAAGLPYEPQVFDPARSDRPVIFAATGTKVGESLLYQRLPLKVESAAYASHGLAFAKAISKREGRIAALTLTLPNRPVALPRLRISGGVKRGDACILQSVDVYAPAMVADDAAALFTNVNGCTWYVPSACQPAKRPKGRVLFVQQLRNGRGFEHRWIDYSALNS